MKRINTIRKTRVTTEGTYAIPEMLNRGADTKSS